MVSMVEPTQHHLALPDGGMLAEYRVERVLGVSGFSITYLAIAPDLDRPVAIEEYLPNDIARRQGTIVRPRSMAHDGEFRRGRDQFLTTARALTEISHANVVRALRVFEAHNTAYLVMEHEIGERLDLRLARHDDFDEVELRRIVLALLDGLDALNAAAHVHGSIEPSAIQLRPDGTPVLMNLAASRAAVTRQGRHLAIGLAPGYAAIEQYTGRVEQGPYTDIYALGAVLYRIVSGRDPLDAPARVLEDEQSPASRLAVGRYSRKFLRAIDGALAVRPEDRPQRLAEWREMLAAPAVSERPAAAGTAAGAAADTSNADLHATRDDNDQDWEPERGYWQNVDWARYIPYGFGAAVSVAVVAAVIGAVGSDRYREELAYGRQLTQRLEQQRLAEAERLFGPLPNNRAAAPRQDSDAETQRQQADARAAEARAVEERRQREIADQQARERQQQAEARSAELKAAEEQRQLAAQRERQQAEARAAEERRQQDAAAQRERERQQAEAKAAEERRQREAAAQQERERQQADARAAEERRQRDIAAQQERERQQAEARATEERRQREVAAQRERERQQAEARAAEERRQRETAAQRERERQQAEARAAEERRQREIAAQRERERQQAEARAAEERRQREIAAQREREQAEARVAEERRQREVAAQQARERQEAEVRAAAARAAEEQRVREAAEARQRELASAGPAPRTEPQPSGRLLGTIGPPSGTPIVAPSGIEVRPLPPATPGNDSIGALIRSEGLSAEPGAATPASRIASATSAPRRLEPPSIIAPNPSGPAPTSAPPAAASATPPPTQAQGNRAVPIALPAGAGEIGRIDDVNVGWGYVVLRVNSPSSIRVGERVYARAGIEKLWMTVRRINGNQVSATPDADLRRFTSDLRVYKE